MTHTAPTGTAARQTSPLTTRNRIGVVLAVLLGLLDISSLATLGTTFAPGEEGPPDVVLVLSAVLGVITIVAAVLAWVRSQRGALRVAAVSRLLSALLGMPAFFVDGVPDPIVAVTTVLICVTVVTVGLLVSRR